MIDDTPSLIGQLLPAVLVPDVENAGFSFAKAANELSNRTD